MDTCYVSWHNPDDYPVNISIHVQFSFYSWENFLSLTIKQLVKAEFKLRLYDCKACILNQYTIWFLH